MKNLLLIVIAFFSLNALAQQKTIKSNTVKKELHKKELHKKQQHNFTKERASMTTKKLTEKLNLSADQQKKIYSLLLEGNKNDIKSKSASKKLISSKDKASKQEVKKAMIRQKGERLDKMNIKFKEILTPKQYEIYKKMNSKNQGDRKKVSINKN
jgi:hypothetical protein